MSINWKPIQQIESEYIFNNGKRLLLIPKNDNNKVILTLPTENEVLKIQGIIEDFKYYCFVNMPDQEIDND